MELQHGRTSRTRELLRLAWPAVLSYILNNTYRINDQFWIQGLGPKAQTAIGATFFIQVLNFAFVFLAVGGALALVSRNVGARDDHARDSFARHSLAIGFLVGLALTAAVVPSAHALSAGVGLDGQAQEMAGDYLGTLYLFMGPIAVFPALDAIFIARGHTRIPMGLQSMAVVMNYVLNPLFIYGKDAAQHVDAPGAEFIASIAERLGIEGHGIAGAAFATGVSRTIVVCAGLLILTGPVRMRFRGPIAFSLRTSLQRALAIVRISAPSSVSIAIYALAYLGLVRFVLSPLGEDTTAGLGLGFQIFEGISFPCYLGVAIAGSSLVGREIGAKNRQGVLDVVRSARFVSRFLGVAFAGIFLFVGPPVVAWFTQDAAVAKQTIIYVQVLAFSQYWVAVEAVNEKVLLGSGQTGALYWIAPLGNVLRIPLGWFLAFGDPGFALGAAGVWWAVNVTTLLKAFLFWQRVQRGAWLDRALAS